MLQLKRAYEKPSPGDGERILVERLWPRGLTKASGAIDLWMKGLAPSPELRKWFSHDPGKSKQLQQRYFMELKQHPEALNELRRRARRRRITLEYAARDTEHNAALALRTFLDHKQKQ